MIPATTSPFAAARPAPAQTDREKVAEAARQFEAIFARRLLAEARKAKPAGENTLFGGQALETFNQMQDERFAQIAAERGAFGLARALEAQLAAAAGLNAAPAPSSAPRAAGAPDLQGL